MKSLKFFSTLSAVAVVSASLSAHAQTLKEPAGFLEAPKTLVAAGLEKPKLNWYIDYPGPSVKPPIITDDSTLHVTVFGVALEGSSGEIPASAKLRLGNTWHHIFSGKGSDVNSSKILFSKFAEAGTELELSVEGSNWGARSEKGKHVVMLKDGDVPPYYAPAFGQGEIVSFLSGYMKNGRISIGDNDVIYLAELYSTNTGSKYYDMQDIVVHVHFEIKQTVTPQQ